MKFILCIPLLFVLSVSASQPLPTPSYIDVHQYVGKWYAIASLPQFFTKNCVGQTAQYEIMNSSTIAVLNTCIKENGSLKTIEGQAKIANAQTNAELVVTFNNFWTKLLHVKGDYTIIKIDESYSTVLVGSKNRKSLWILARTPYINESVKAEYINYAKKLNFDTSKIIDSKF